MNALRVVWNSTTNETEFYKEVKTMNRIDALKFVAVGVDNALCPREPSDAPANARLIGWQCGFEPMFVAAWSYLGGRLNDDEAVELATDLLVERKWFAGEPTAPDFVV